MVSNFPKISRSSLLKNRKIELSSRLLLWLMLAGIALIILVFLFGGDSLWQTLMIKNRLVTLEAKIDSLETVNAQMEKQIEGLQNGDITTIEEEARSQGFLKPGEKVYLMRPEAEKKTK